MTVDPTPSIADVAPVTVSPNGEPSHRREWLPTALVILGVGLTLNSLVGPLLADLVDYPLSATLRNQTIGLDAANLLVVAPASIAVAVLIRRSNPLGTTLAAVVGSYTTYMFLQFVVGPDYDHYPGTLPLMMGLFILGWLVAKRAWSLTRARQSPPMSPAARSRHAMVLLVFAGFVILRYLPGLPAALANESIPEGSLGDPAMFWTIFLMDLGIFVPLVISVSLALRRGADWALGGLHVAVGWFTLVNVAVLSMSIAMLVNDDLYAAGQQVVMFAVITAAMAAYATRLLRPSAGNP